MRLIPALTAVLAGALLLAGCDFDDFNSFQADFHYHYDLQPGGRLDIDNANGSVEIVGWDRHEVEITGVKYASRQSLLDEVRIDIRNAPDSIAIHTSRPSYPGWNAGARYTIRVPRQTIIDRVSTSNAPIMIRNLGSADSLRTLTLRTSNGLIRAENVAAVIDAQTSNGWVDLDQIDGGATVRTSNGRVTVRLNHLKDSPLRVVTSNGSVDLTVRNQPEDAIRAETSNGSITLHLPADAGAQLRADTSNSSISTDFDVLQRFQDHGRLDGRLGNGGPEVELSTRNGHISVLKNHV
jgi:Putative adhesin